MEIGRNSSSPIQGALQLQGAQVRDPQQLTDEQARLRREQLAESLRRGDKDRTSEQKQEDLASVADESEEPRESTTRTPANIPAITLETVVDSREMGATPFLNRQQFEPSSSSQQSAMPQRVIQMALQAYNTATASPIIIGGGELMPRFDAMA